MKLLFLLFSFLMPVPQETTLVIVDVTVDLQKDYRTIDWSVTTDGDIWYTLVIAHEITEPTKRLKEKNWVLMQHTDAASSGSFTHYVKGSAKYEYYVITLCRDYTTGWNYVKIPDKGGKP